MYSEVSVASIYEIHIATTGLKNPNGVIPISIICKFRFKFCYY